MLSNIYLHYALDLWFERRFKKTCQGYAGLTRFADDFVVTYRYLSDAQRFRQEMEERLAAFRLRVATEKTALLYFQRDDLLGKGRPTRKLDTFVILGFTHYLAKARSGILTIVLKPSVKARERFVSNARIWLKLNRHLPVRDQRAHLDKMVNGFYQYFGLRLCCTLLYGVRQRVLRSWVWALKRRGQKAKRRCDWAILNAQPWFQLPIPRVTQAWV